MAKPKMKSLAAIPTLFFLLLLVVGGSAAATATDGEEAAQDEVAQVDAVQVDADDVDAEHVDADGDAQAPVGEEPVPEDPVGEDVPAHEDAGGDVDEPTSRTLMRSKRASRGSAKVMTPPTARPGTKGVSSSPRPRASTPFLRPGQR